MKRPSSLFAAVCLLVIACSPSPVVTSPPSAAPSIAPSETSPTAEVTPAASLDRTAGWTADLQALIPGMDALHPDLEHGVTTADLQAAVDALIATIPTATDHELMVGLLRIVAMVSASGCDGHTGAFVWGTGSYPVTSLPLRLWLFGDQVFIVDALAPHEDLIGAEILEIDGHPIGDVLEALDPITPRDNAQTVRLLAPRFLLIPEILNGLGLADGTRITLNLQSATLAPADVLVESIPMADYNAWAGSYGLHLPVDPDVLWLSRIDDPLWWQPLDDSETLFVQYNRVDRLGPGILNELRTALHDEAIGRVILDLRHNFGGELSALDPILDLFDDPAVDRPGELFVAMGRNTFSAGSILVARLERDTGATFVGEAAGGCPTLWGDSQELLLPFSGIAVSVATEPSVGVDPNDPRQLLEPDAQAELTIDEWQDGIDPALQVILPVPP